MYHYTECGLDNVWLANGFTTKKTAYGEAVAITHADALHKRLAEDLINKPARLTGKEFRFLRVLLKLSQAAVARMQGVSEQNISLWERHDKVHKANDKLIRCFYVAHESKNQRPINSAGPEVSVLFQRAVSTHHGAADAAIGQGLKRGLAQAPDPRVGGR